MLHNPLLRAVLVTTSIADWTPSLDPIRATLRSLECLDAAETLVIADALFRIALLAGPCVRGARAVMWRMSQRRQGPPERGCGCGWAAGTGAGAMNPNVAAATVAAAAVAAASATNAGSGTVPSVQKASDKAADRKSVV